MAVVKKKCQVCDCHFISLERTTGLYEVKFLMEVPTV